MKCPEQTSKHAGTAKANSSTTRRRLQPVSQHNSNDHTKVAQLFADLERCMSELRDGCRGAADEILLDRQLDGCRLLLIRTIAEGRRDVSLSPREREICHLIARGEPDKGIADVLQISTCTVGTHLRRIFAKLGVHSRAAMVAQVSGFDGRSRPKHLPTLGS
jgi:DNA-binding CsgD family transcriptional regulator